MKAQVIVNKLEVKLDNKVILKVSNFRAKQGEVILISGPTGIGKSTFLKTICGIIPYIYRSFKVKGHIQVCGYNPNIARKKRLVAYVPQDPWNYMLSFSLLDEIKLLGKEVNHDLIKLLGLKEVVNTPYDLLSDGQKYKALVYMALELGVKIIALDEPTTHIDYWNIREIINYLKYMAKKEGITILVSDHNVKYLKEHVDRIFQIKQITCKYKEPNISNTRKYDEYMSSKQNHCVFLNNVWFRYRGSEWILRNITLRIEPGNIISILGPNGSGKTTLLKVIAGIYKPTKGDRIANGNPFYIPQSPIYWFSEDKVYSEIRKYSNHSKDEYLDLLKYLEIQDKLHENPYSLSIGEARKLSIALAYLSNAPIVIIDEPSLGLDECSRHKVKLLLRKMVDNSRAIILATHDVLFASSISDEVYFLKDGTLINDIPIGDLND